uniref:Uncharacterized protein n=1 Tax=Erythrolobus australicus TaxID=1077150 RepID=A0A7S1TJJ6_9RHOD|mmetsp:Transcript_1018/g.2937  ORF Transcript_1018/g.2937 Transcript_1018/m.2937 type:complete len:233 (+) Transcript_1018:295-993(+)
MIVLNEAMVAKISAKKQKDTHHGTSSQSDFDPRSDAPSRTEERTENAALSPGKRCEPTPELRPFAHEGDSSSEHSSSVLDKRRKADGAAVPAPDAGKFMTLAEKLAAKRAAQKVAADVIAQEPLMDEAKKCGATTSSNDRASAPMTLAEKLAAKRAAEKNAKRSPDQISSALPDREHDVKTEARAEKEVSNLAEGRESTVDADRKEVYASVNSTTRDRKKLPDAKSRDFCSS